MGRSMHYFLYLSITGHIIGMSTRPAVLFAKVLVTEHTQHWNSRPGYFNSIAIDLLIHTHLCSTFQWVQWRDHALNNKPMDPDM